MNPNKYRQENVDYYFEYLSHIIDVPGERVRCEVSDWTGMAPRQLLLETVRQVAGTALQGRGKRGKAAAAAATRFARAPGSSGGAPPKNRARPCSPRRISRLTAS